MDAIPRGGFDPRVWLLALGTFAIGTDAFVIAGILPALAADFAVGIEGAGFIVSAYALTYGLGTPLLAAVIAHWPRHRVVLITLYIFALVNALCAVAPNYAFLIAMRVAAGLCAAIYTPTAYALAASLARPEKRGAALSAVAIGLSAASVAGVPLGTWVGHAFDWRATFWLIAAITVAGAAALQWRGIPASGDAFQSAASLAVRIAPLGRKRVWMALLPSLLLYISTSLTYTYVALLLGTHYAVAALPILLVVYGLGGLVGSQVGGRLADRLGPARPIFIGLSMLTLIQIAVPFSLDSIVATCAVLFLVTMSNWGCFAPMQARLMQLEPANANIVIALINSAVYIGNAIGAMVGATLLRFMPVTDLPFASALVSLAAILILARKLPD